MVCIFLIFADFTTFPFPDLVLFLETFRLWSGR